MVKIMRTIETKLVMERMLILAPFPDTSLASLSEHPTFVHWGPLPSPEEMIGYLVTKL